MTRLATVSLAALAALFQGCAQRPLTMPYSTAAANAATPVVVPAAAAPAPTVPATPYAQPTPPVAPMVAPMPMQASNPPAGSGHTMNCAPITESQVAQLFDRWNASLMTHDPRKVVENYAPHSLLLPTMSNKPRYSVEDKIDYFEHFLHDGPVGKIDQRFIQVGCNTALDIGLYTFSFFKTGKVVHARYSYTYGYVDGHWLITSHHSSGMPEPEAVATPAAEATHAPAPAKAPAKAPVKAAPAKTAH